LRSADPALGAERDDRVWRLHLRAIRADFLVLTATLRFDPVVGLLKTCPASEPFTESRANAHRLPVPQADPYPVYLSRDVITLVPRVLLPLHPACRAPHHLAVLTLPACRRYYALELSGRQWP
jgi:hypothetical protein